MRGVRRVTMHRGRSSITRVLEHRRAAMRATTFPTYSATSSRLRTTKRDRMHSVSRSRKREQTTARSGWSITTGRVVHTMWRRSASRSLCTKIWSTFRLLMWYGPSRTSPTGSNRPNARSCLLPSSGVWRRISKWLSFQATYPRLPPTTTARRRYRGRSCPWPAILPGRITSIFSNRRVSSVRVSWADRTPRVHVIFSRGYAQKRGSCFHPTTTRFWTISRMMGRLCNPNGTHQSFPWCW